MAKLRRPRLRRKSPYVDPAVDQLAVLDARNMLFANMLGMGIRLAFMVLVPIFIGLKLDEYFDSKPSATLAAFIIAIYGSGVMIYRNYVSMTNESTKLESKKRTKRSTSKEGGK